MRLLSRSYGRASAWSNRFSSLNAVVAPGLQVRRAILIDILSISVPPSLPRDGAELVDHHHIAQRSMSRLAMSRAGFTFEPFRSALPKSMENGSWLPSTIKRITGCAYGFRRADPPFFRLIAATALPFNSHQE